MYESTRREATIEEEQDEEEPDTIATDSQAGSGVATDDDQNGPVENRASANLGVKPARRASEDEICECGALSRTSLVCFFLASLLTIYLGIAKGDSSVWGGMVCCSCEPRSCLAVVEPR